MSGILRLESLTKGNTLKQGDKTPLKYRLFDADGEKLNIAGKSAKVRLVYPDFLTIGYEKDDLTVAQDDTVTFTIDGVIPARIYHVEIIVDDKFIFPSRADESKFTVDKSSLGTESNIIEIVGVDAVVRKAVDLINKDPNLIIDEDKLVTDIISNTGIGNINEYYQAFNDLKPKAEQSITKSAEALTKSQNALNVANGIDAKATNALSLSESADILSKSVQEQFNQVVIEGDSSVEAAQARVDANGQTNPTLKARLDKEHNEVTTKLAQNERQFRNNSKPRPIITIESDDGFMGDYTHLYPFLKARGIPGTTSFPSNYVGFNGRPDDEIGWSKRMGLDELNELVDNGWSIISHTQTERRMGDIPLAEVEVELRESKKALSDLGFKVEHFNYPQGSHSLETLRIASKYYKSSRIVTRGVNLPPVQSQRLLGTMVLKEAGDNQEILDYIDHAKEKNGWLILYVHGNEFQGYDFRGNYIGEGMKQNLAEAIDYAESLGFAFLNRDDAWEEFGNSIDLGLQGVDDKSFSVTSRGELSINNELFDGSRIVIDKDPNVHGITRQSRIDKFKFPAITATRMDVQRAIGFPEDKPGTLLTYRLSEWGGYPFQEYHIISENKVYRRVWEGNYWGQFELLNVVKLIPTFIDAQITATTSIDKFSKNQITYNQITGGKATGFPENKAGTLITHYIIEYSGYPYQEYHIVSENKVYRRYWTNGVGWGNFVLVTQPIT